MYDRYDSNKGRYVSYDYEPKGDRFSRGLSELPRVYKTFTHTDTGHTYKRRVRTSEVRSLTVSSVKRFLPAEVKANLEHHTVYLRADTLILFSRTPPGLAVDFEVTEQAKGKRHWFICVGCEQRVGKLYMVPGPYWPTWGCQKCLGLSYPSQARHKSAGRDNAIVEGKIKVSFNEWCRAHERYEKRMLKLIAKVDRMTERFL